MVKLFSVLPLIAGASAHLSFWHPSMYGYDVPKGDPHWPVANLRHLPFKDWWFHGNIDKPPADGEFFELPAGGTAHGQIGCGKGQTTFGGKQTADLACPDNAKDAIHMGGGVKGCAIAIAYESDVHKIKPEDFRVVTVNHECPLKRDVDFEIPKGLPPCPPGGCHCQWAWIHSKEGGVDEIYFTGFKCKVKDADANAPPLPKPQVAKKCVGKPDECVKPLKQPLYWMQLEGNNMNNTVGDPPFYNMDYGFTNGAQDLWAGTTPNNENGGETQSPPAESTTSEAPSVSSGEPSPRPTGPTTKIDPITSGQGPRDPTETASTGTVTRSYTRGSGYDDAGHTLPTDALHVEPTDVPTHDGKPGKGSASCRARKRSRVI